MKPAVWTFFLLALVGSAQEPAAGDAARLRAEGERLLAEGKASEATERFRAAKEADGGTLESRAGLARALLADGRLNDALDELDEAERAKPGDAEVLYLFGKAFLRKAERLASEEAPYAARRTLADARDHLERAASAGTARAEAFVLLAQVRLAFADPDGAEGALAQAARLDPKAMGVERWRSEVALVRYEAAKTNGSDGATRQRLAASALEALGRAATADPQDALSRTRLGGLLLERGRGEEAARAFVEAVALDPGIVDGSVFTERLHPSTAQKVLEEAIGRFEASKPAAPNAEATLQWYLGYVLLRAKDFGGAAAAFERSVRKNPEFTNAHYWGGLASLEKGDLDEAAESWAAFAEKDAEGFVEFARTQIPDRDRFRASLVRLVDRAARSRNTKTARALLSVLAPLEPENPDHWNNLAFFSRQTGRNEESFAAYEKALALRPEDPALLNDAAVILHYNLRRDLNRARKMYEKAVECAKRVLADRDADSRAREEAQTALRDAEGNLRRLQAGKMTEHDGGR